MSWLFGEIVKTKNSFSNFNEKIKNESVHSFQSDAINIFAGGNLNNLFNLEVSNAQYFISGIGITTQNNVSKVMGTAEWKLLLKNDIENVLNIDGHFVIIKVEKESINIYTDKLGLRDIYIKELDDKIIFSTKIEWLTYYDNLEIDFSVFGSRWLLHNQISQDSVFINTLRLVAGKSVNINIKNHCVITQNEYRLEYSKTPLSSEEYEAKLLSLINLNVKNAEKLSLSLSGGMDSRVLLSLLINNRKEFFETHSFGNPNHPDCMIAKKIVGELNIKHYQYNGIIENSNKIISDLKTYTVDNIVNNAASAILQLNNYKYLSNRNLIVVDGAPGEIWRNEYFFNMLLRGKKSLLDGNIKEIESYLSMQRADIFNEDTTIKMKAGLRKQFEEVFEYLPKINKYNIREWLDLLVIHTRIPNYIGHEQGRLDGLITCIMPFAQISLLSNLFSLDPNEKNNAKLFRKIIRQNSPKLVNYPLVKGTSQHPFFLNTLFSRVWPRIRTKIMGSYSEVSNTDKLLFELKEFVYDSVHSKSITESEILHKTKIQNMVNEYYNGKQKNGYSVDWLLSFVIFHQSISKSQN